MRDFMIEIFESLELNSKLTEASASEKSYLIVI